MPKDGLGSVKLTEIERVCVRESVCVRVCKTERERSAVVTTVQSMLKHICLPTENCSTGGGKKERSTKRRLKGSERKMKGNS